MPSGEEGEEAVSAEEVGDLEEEDELEVEDGEAVEEEAGEDPKDSQQGAIGKLQAAGTRKGHRPGPVMYKEVRATEPGMQVRREGKDRLSNHREIDRLLASNPQGEAMPAHREVTGPAQGSFLRKEEALVPEVTVPVRASFPRRVATARQEATRAIAETLTSTTAIT